VGPHRVRPTKVGDGAVIVIASSASFNLFERPNGARGIRNHLAVVSTVVCSNVVATKIAQSLQAEVIAHDAGCLQLGQDRRRTVDLLVGIASSPNVGAALLVGLGCEQQPPETIVSAVRQKRLNHLTIQGSGGTSSAVDSGVEEARSLTASMTNTQMVPGTWSDLTVAFRVSDDLPETNSKISQAFGALVDFLAGLNATIIIAETWPFIAEPQFVADMFDDPQQRERWLSIADERATQLEDLGAAYALSHTSPPKHNTDGSTSGPLQRLGTRGLRGVLEYGEIPTGPGVWLMDSPREDLFVGAGLITAGTHVLIHGSTRPSLYSPPVLPVLKVAGSAKTYSAMPDVYDVDASVDLDMDAISQRILLSLEEVVAGAKTSSERWAGQELAIPRIGATL